MEDTVAMPQVSQSDLDESKSHVVTDFLVKYAKTKKDKVKYTPEKEEETKDKIDKLNKKNEKDFTSKAKTIRNGAYALIDANEEKEKALIKLSKPKLKSQFRLERFNKSKDDVDENGQNYSPVKTTFEEELTQLEQNDEEYKKKLEEIANNQNNTSDENNENTVNANGKNKKNKIKKNHDKAVKPEPVYKQGNASTIAIDVGRTYDQQIDAYKKASTENINRYKAEVEGNARKRGYELGADDVQKYNNAIKKQAKKTFNKNKKLLMKGETKKNSLLQKVKLKLGALLGL